MDCQKGMENINGWTAQCSRATLSKAHEMATGFGRVKNRMVRFTKGIICWIESTDMEYTIGAMGMSTKDFGWTICGMAREHYLTMINYSTTVIGRMERKLTTSPNQLQSSNPPCMRLRRHQLELTAGTFYLN